MKLLYAPGACSIGIHFLLEEIGKPYETQAIALRDGAQYKGDYTAVNPKSKVPTLVRDDGSVVTEFPAIAYYLGASAPEKHLVPTGIEAQTRMLETMDYIVASMHMQGYTRIFRPEKFSTDTAAVVEEGKKVVATGMKILNDQLAGRDFALGDFSVADAALFYIEFWHTNRMGAELPPNLAAHWQRLSARPSVQNVLKDEGFAV